MEAAKLNCFLLSPLPIPIPKPLLCLPSLKPLTTRTRVSNHTSRTLTRQPRVSLSSNKPVVSDELRKETEEILEWPAVCSQVSAFSATAAGRALCRSAGIPVGRNREESERLLEQTKAAAELPEPLDFSGVDDVSEIVRAAAGGGELLAVQQICSVKRSILAARGVFEQLEKVSSCEGFANSRYSPLFDILQDCDFLTELTGKIEFCLDCTLSTILDRSSTKLKSIRSDRKKNMEKLDSLLKEVSAKVFQAGGIDSPLVTRRRSRMCVGIKASNKSLLPGGIVLSVSSSGATYFMEPREAVDLNNMEIRLTNSERAEELVVLGFLTSEIAVSETKIRHLMEKILELDIACARGAYAQWGNGVCPIFCEVHVNRVSNREVLSVDIEGIRHPLLEPSLRSLSSGSVSLSSKNFIKVEKPVPLDIKIGQATKVVVISGPNTGGKTATMKTLGLASIMSKAGIFLPAKGTPRLPWFDQILADIGDRQSLEHSLSTFSGHISRICKIIEVLSEESLVLIDEIGSGTDPSEGVALSTSILEHIANCVNLAVVTTHYADLSLLKVTDSRFENAAMEFCIETLQPTYRIMWGGTGNSNALSIARSIGFDQKVLSRAKEWVEKLVPDKQMERQGFLYNSLLEERNLLEAQAREASSVLSEVKKLHLEIHSEAIDLEKREAVLKAKEVRKLQKELKAANSQMDTIIANFEIQLQDATPDEFNSIIRGSEAAISSIVAAHCPSGNTLSEDVNSQNSYIPKLGDKVYIKGLGAKLATIVEVDAEDGTAMVQYGKIKVRVKKSDVKPIQSNTKQIPNGSQNLELQAQRRLQQRPIITENKLEETSFGPAVKTSKNTVDLRGLRAEEASDRLHVAISETKSYGVLFVIHGTGTGVVKERALKILRNHPRVVKFEEESPMNYGCTVAYIK